MADKINGTGSRKNGQDKGKLLHFPTLAERDRHRREKQAEKAAKAKKPHTPFFNYSKIPPFTRALVALFIVIHIALRLLFAPPGLYDVFSNFGFVPASYTGARTFAWPAIFAPLTHLFIHGSWMHLFFNTTMALIMGMAFEREFGARTTALFFFGCGLAGALLYFAFAPFSMTPVIGASAGLSGLFGAVIILLFQRRPLAQETKYGPWPLVVFWIAFMAGAGILSGDSMAWQAHIGGFIAGILFLRVLQKRKKPGQSFPGRYH